MTRRPVFLLHLAAKRFAMLLLILFVASCGKDQAPNAPTGTFTGSKSAPGQSATFVDPQGIVVLPMGASFSTFLTSHSLELVDDLTLPAAGSFGAATYYLVRTADGSRFKDVEIAPEELEYRSDHPTIWVPEDDRDGLTFDDTGSRRTQTQYSSQPAFWDLNIHFARNISEGAGTRIALFDTGVDPSHPLFQNPKMKFTSGGNYLTFPPTLGSTSHLEQAGNGLDDDGDGYEDDGVGHGTYVAGLLYMAARMANVRVYKVLDQEGRGTAFGLAKAIKAATDAGVQVMNLSLGLNLDNQMVHHVIAHAAAQGIVVVASAGNKGSSEPQFPAGYDEVISVTAVDDADVKYEFGNYGGTIDIAAPGVDVISAIPGLYGSNQYAVARGTSAAVPFVSGAVAMVLARDPSYVTPQMAAGIVLGSTDDISAMNPGVLLGSGRVDLGSAAQTLIPGPLEE